MRYGRLEADERQALILETLRFVERTLRAWRPLSSQWMVLAVFVLAMFMMTVLLVVLCSTREAVSDRTLLTAMTIPLLVILCAALVAATLLRRRWVRMAARGLRFIRPNQGEIEAALQAMKPEANQIYSQLSARSLARQIARDANAPTPDIECARRARGAARVS